MWVMAAVGVAAAMAFGLPRLARHVPWSGERWLGRAIGAAAPAPVCAGRGQPESVAAFDKLVRRIYPLSADDRAVPITIEVARGDTVNAFATLGGHVYVFEGLIRQAGSPEELAGVLAHEIEHVRNRHVIQGVAVNLFTLAALRVVLPGESDEVQTRTARLFLSMQFSRRQEAEADRKGLERLRVAQVDAAGFAQFFARAQAMAAPPAILSSHPSNESRQALAMRFRGYATVPVLDPTEWAALRAICRQRPSASSELSGYRPAG
jgi:predicted Zn-dependent protease